MASCPDSDNSWVLAGSEVGKAGLGATWNGGSCRAGLLAASVTFLGLGDHVHHLLLVVRGTLVAGRRPSGPRSQVLGLGPCLERRKLLG